MIIMCTIIETENRNRFIKMLSCQIFPGVLCRFLCGCMVTPSPLIPSQLPLLLRKKTGERAIGGRRGMGGVGVLDFGL